MSSLYTRTLVPWSSSMLLFWYNICSDSQQSASRSSQLCVACCPICCLRVNRQEDGFMIYWQDKVNWSTRQTYLFDTLISWTGKQRLFLQWFVSRHRDCIKKVHHSKSDTPFTYFLVQHVIVMGKCINNDVMRHMEVKQWILYSRSNNWMQLSYVVIVDEFRELQWRVRNTHTTRHPKQLNLLLMKKVISS